MDGAPVKAEIADRSLAALGRLRIAWADAEMPVLRSIRERFVRERPLSGLVVGVCLHITTETGELPEDSEGGRGDGARVRVQSSVDTR